MSRLLFGAVAVVSFLLSGTANAALYSQLSSPFVKTTFNDPVLGDVNAYISQNDGALDPAVVYDNFSLASNASVNKISWVGAYLLSTAGILPTFQVSFFENGVGAPGAQIGVPLTVSATEALQSDPGFFLYTAELAAPVAFMGGTEYWLSVVANVPDTDLWGWAITGAPVSTSLDGSVQDFAGNRFIYPTVDFAFSLDGPSNNVIPEPMSALVFVGLIGGMAIYRRKKAISANAS